MVRAVAALLLVVAVSNVGALECPSGSLHYANEELSEMNAEKVNEKLDRFEVTCIVNAANAWCYSRLLLDEARGVVFHCADPSTARECAQLSADGKYCNDQGTLCCCNSSGCKAVLSYPFIRNNGTNAPLPSTEGHQVVPDESSEREHVSITKNGHNHNSSLNASSEESHHNNTSHRTKDAHQEKSTNTSDLFEDSTSHLGDSIHVSSASADENSTNVNLPTLGRDEEDKINQILSKNRSSAENQSMEIKANHFVEKNSHTLSANDSKENSAEASELKLSKETSEQAAIYHTPEMNSTIPPRTNSGKEDWKSSKKMQKLMHKDNSSLITESSQEHHSRSKTEKLNQPATSTTGNLKQDVDELNSTALKMLSNDTDTISNSTETESSSEHRALPTEETTIRNSTIGSAMESENNTSQHEQEFIQNIMHKDDSTEKHQHSNHTATQNSNFDGGVENSIIDHGHDLAEELIRADSANSTREAGISNSTSEQEQDLAHDVTMADSPKDLGNHTEPSSSIEGSHESVHKPVKGSQEKKDNSTSHENTTNHSSHSAEATEPPSMKDLCPVLPTTPCPDCSRATTDAISADPEEGTSSACPAALSSSNQATTVMWAMWIAPWLILLPIICVLAYLLRKSSKAVEQLTAASTPTPLANMKIERI